MTQQDLSLKLWGRMERVRKWGHRHYVKQMAWEEYSDIPTSTTCLKILNSLNVNRSFLFSTP